MDLSLDKKFSKLVANLGLTLGNLSDDIFADIKKDQMRTLLIDTRSTLSSAITVLSIFLQPSNRFSTPQPLTSVARTISSSTPKMNHVCSVVAFGEVMTFTGTLNVLDIQSRLDKRFGIDPIMILVIPRNKRHCATEDTEYLASKELNFCNFCRLHIFCNSVQSKYADTAIYDSQKNIVDIYLIYSLRAGNFSNIKQLIQLFYRIYFSSFTAL